MKGGIKLTYIINEKTLAITRENKKTRIIEKYNSYLVSEDPVDIINLNCKLYGSTLEGRQKGSAYLIGTNYKPPIIVNNGKNIILVPTHSHRNNKCSWIVLRNLANYFPYENDVIIEFQNEIKILLNISYTIFDKQVLRAARLESVMRNQNSQKSL